MARNKDRTPGAEGLWRCGARCYIIPEKFHHPSTFPLELPRWCIRLHGVRHPMVLDPFMGTGTTLLAAALEGGQGIGIELDPSYLAVARQRLAAMQGELIPAAPP